MITDLFDHRSDAGHTRLTLAQRAAFTKAHDNSASFDSGPGPANDPE